MVLQTNVSTGTPVGAATYNRGPTPITQSSIYVWCATARDLSIPAGGANSIIDEMGRTSSTCYMRGLKEKITFSTNDATPWLWRRIVFYSKNPSLRASTTGAGNTFSPIQENSAGYARVVNQPVIGGAYDDVIWKGTQNTDWDDFMTAPIDNRRVDLAYDKTISIAPGAQGGVYRSYNRWHPINKSIVFDDEEQGGVENQSSWSVLDKRGAGDMYVIDVFKPGASLAGSSVLYFKPEATLYWHEK
jgi:hypothetical protein